MKKNILLFIFFLTFANFSFASEHGIYTKVFENLSVSVDEAGNKLVETLKSAGYEILSYENVATPAIVRKDNSCNFKAKRILFRSDKLIKKLTSIDDKYLLASFLKIGIYEDEHGVQVNIADPETIGRIVLNDLWENGKEKEYNNAVNWLHQFRENLISTIHSAKLGKEVTKTQPPIRSGEDIRESSKDMFMMVGQLTFFNDEDQFPAIFSEPSNSPRKDLVSLLEKIKNNIKKFTPTKEDIEYRLTKSPDVLKWKIEGEIFSPDSNAFLIGITRPRTEGLSFHIAGSARESDKNKCPGLDHVPAFPIEVLGIYQDGKIMLYTAREMFRMDMYFWDAGMSAFMNHMSMPSLLDESIKKALLNK